jgi:hypothetical protein
MRHHGYKEHDFVTGFQHFHVISIGERKRMSKRQRPGHTGTLQKEIKIKIKIKILGSECQTSGTYAKRAKQATKKKTIACFY